MSWRLGISVLYGLLLVFLSAYANDNDGWLISAGFLAAPIVGFATGRWWVVVVAIGAVIGTPIGWDSDAHDGHSPFNPLYGGPSWAVVLAVLLAVGVGMSKLVGVANQKRARPADPDT